MGDAADSGETQECLTEKVLPKQFEKLGTKARDVSSTHELSYRQQVASPALPVGVPDMSRHPSIREVTKDV